MRYLIFALALLAISCQKVVLEIPDDEFQQLTIPRGYHSARPYYWYYDYLDTLKVHYVFTPSAFYDIGYPDQKDWSKLIGFSFLKNNNHRNSVMVGWRPNLDCNCMEFTSYVHYEGSVIIPVNPKPIPGHDSQVLAIAKATANGAGSVKTAFYINRQNGEVTTLINDSIINITQFQPQVIDNKVRVINPWFGGNRVAPHDIYLLRKRY